jgi:hypothetical protein
MMEQEKLAKNLSRKKHLSIEKIAKVEQTLLLYLLYKTILKGKSYKLDKQKMLAKELAKHYNSIYRLLKKLRKEGFLKTKRTREQTRVSLNLDRFEVKSLITILSRKTAQKLYLENRTRRLKAFDQPEKTKQSAQEYRFWEEQALFLLKCKKELSEQLAIEIITKLKEAERKKNVPLDLEDYCYLILLKLQEIGECQPEITLSLLEVPDQLRYTNTSKKLGII